MGRQEQVFCSDVIGKPENLDGPVTCDFLAGECGLSQADDPGTSSRARHGIPSASRAAAYHLIDRENRTVGERKLFALVDAVACVLAHGERSGSRETARLAFETVVGSAVALAAVRVLVECRDSA